MNNYKILENGVLQSTMEATSWENLKHKLEKLYKTTVISFFDTNGADDAHLILIDKQTGKVLIALEEEPIIKQTVAN